MINNILNIKKKKKIGKCAYWISIEYFYGDFRKYHNVPKLDFVVVFLISSYNENRCNTNKQDKVISNTNMTAIDNPRESNYFDIIQW